MDPWLLFKLRKVWNSRLTKPTPGMYSTLLPNNRRASRAVLEEHEAAVIALAVNPGGDLIASGSIDHTVRLWDAATGKPRAVLRGHTDAVFAVAFSPDGGQLVSGSADGTVRVWDVSTHAELAKLDAGGDVSALAFSPDGVRLPGFVLP